MTVGHGRISKIGPICCISKIAVDLKRSHPRPGRRSPNHWPGSSTGASPGHHTGHHTSRHGTGPCHQHTYRL